MARPLRIFNLCLALLAVGLLVALGQSLWGLTSPASAPAPSSSGQPAKVQTPGPESAPPVSVPSLPPLSEFAIISDKDLFKNPNPEPARTAVAQKPPPPASPPLPTLVGTIFAGEERKAILSDGKRADLYTVGQPVAGGILVKIEGDRVVIQRGESQAEVLLRSSIQQVLRPTTPAPPAPQGAETAPTAETHVPPTSAVPQESTPRSRIDLDDEVERDEQEGIRPEIRPRRTTNTYSERKQKYQSR